MDVLDTKHVQHSGPTVSALTVPIDRQLRRTVRGQGRAMRISRIVHDSYMTHRHTGPHLGHLFALEILHHSQQSARLRIL